MVSVKMSVISTMAVVGVVVAAPPSFPAADAIDAFTASCPVPPVFAIDAYNYTGRWYEIGTTDFTRATIERGCICVEARYSLRTNGDIAVQNVCNNATQNNNITLALGNAVVVTNTTTGAFQGLAVSFPGFVSKSVNYIPVKIFGDYEQVLIGTPCFTTMWILARTRRIPKVKYEEIVTFAESVGFNTTKIGFSKSDQSCRKRDRRNYPPTPPRKL